MKQSQLRLILVSITSFVLGSQSAGGLDVPLEPVGMQIRGVIGVANVTLFRDFIVDDEISPWGSFTVSSHGVSVSGWASAASGSEATVSELHLTYSHKLPVVDLHVGLSRIDVPYFADSDPFAWRVVLSTNNSSSTLVDVGVDWFIHDDRPLLSSSVTTALVRREKVLVDLRGGYSYWGRDGDDADGWSLRVIAALRQKRGPRVTTYLGFAESSGVISASSQDGDGVIAGVSLGFR